MPLLTKEALLGASDLVEREVELDSIGGSVRIRSLSAAFSNEVFDKATELEVDQKGETIVRVSPAKLQRYQVLHGLIDPKLDSLDEVDAFAQNVGRAWTTLVEAIDEISATNKEAVQKTDTLFRAGGQEEEQEPAEVDAVGVGDGGSDLPVRVGVAAGDVGE